MLIKIFTQTSFLLILIFFCSSCSTVEDPATVLFVGDTYFGESYLEKLDENVLETEGYGYSLMNFESILDDADYVVANLETPITDLAVSPFEGVKDYIHASDPGEALDLYKKHNILNFSLANNHSLDYGVEGLGQTLDLLNEYEMNFFGAGVDEESAMEPLILESNNMRIAIIAGYKFSKKYDEVYDFYAGEGKAGVNLLEVESMSKKIKSLKSQDPEIFVIIFPHWGSNYTERSENQATIAHDLIEAGADLIVGHGAHKMQEIEQYKSKWIIYSIGNFVFNSPGRYESNKVEPFSVIVRMELEGKDGVLFLYPIFTDNIITNYKSRFVTEEEFAEISDTYMSSIDVEEGRDEFGSYFKLAL